MSKTAFTLAEVLIILAIVGVVAVLTIPVLVKNINEKVKTHQIEVITNRFEQGLKLYSTQDSALNGATYSDTEDFLNGLSKHFKMVKICGSSNLNECFPYQEINYEKSDGSIGQQSVKDITLSTLHLKARDYYAPAAFITASGTPYIVALKKNCTIDPDSTNENPSSCIAGFYDYNGARIKNQEGSDVLSMNGARLSSCLMRRGGTCITAILPKGSITPVTDCNETTLEGKYAKYTKSCCSHSHCLKVGDYWLGASVACDESGGRLPNKTEDKSSILRILYGDNVPINFYGNVGGDIDIREKDLQKAATEFGFTFVNNYIGIWASSEVGDNLAEYYHLLYGDTGISATRSIDFDVICIK